MFNRTLSGLINKFLFYPEPIVWVEGVDDFVFYEPLVHRLNCRIEAAGGRDECKKLAVTVIKNNYPFIVVIDGDYEILERDNVMQHESVVLLNKYSIENYLFEKEVIQSVCAKYIGSVDGIEEMGEFFDEVEADIREQLFELIILDVANNKNGLGYGIFPDAAEQIIDLPTMHCLPNKVGEICESIRVSFSKEHRAEAQTLVENFLLRGRFSDLIRGHFIFGIIRNLIITGLKRIKKKKPNIDNDSMLIMLALELWNIIPSENHRELKSRLEAAIAKAIQLKADA